MLGGEETQKAAEGSVGIPPLLLLLLAVPLHVAMTTNLTHFKDSISLKHTPLFRIFTAMRH